MATVASSRKTTVKRTTRRSRPASSDPALETDGVFEVAAEVFRVMSAPMRLKIIASLCNGEKNVSELLAEVQTTQPNMSQHLNALFKAKILGRRREGVQIYYRLINEQLVTICRAMCQHVATVDDTEGDEASG